MPRRIPASHWQPIDRIWDRDALTAPIVQPLRDTLAHHFPDAPPRKLVAAFWIAHGAVFSIIADRLDDEGRPRGASVRQNLGALQDALGDAIQALSALDPRSQRALFRAAGKPPAMHYPAMHQPVLMSDLKPSRIPHGLNATPGLGIAAGRGLVRHLFAACAAGRKWADDAVGDLDDQDTRAPIVPRLGAFTLEMAWLWERMTGTPFVGSPSRKRVSSMGFLSAMMAVAGVNPPPVALDRAAREAARITKDRRRVIALRRRLECWEMLGAS